MKISFEENLKQSLENLCKQIRTLGLMDEEIESAYKEWQLSLQKD